MKKIFILLTIISTSFSVSAQTEKVYCSADQMTLKNKKFIENRSANKETTLLFSEGKDLASGKIQLADSEFDISTKRNGYIWLKITQGESTRSIVGNFSSAKEARTPRFIWDSHETKGDVYVYQRLECKLLDKK